MIEIKLVEEKLMRSVNHIAKGSLTTNSFREMAYDLLEQTPESLKQNILEWLFDKPISDIEYKGLTYNQFIKMLSTPNSQLNLYNFDFLFEQFIFFANEGQDKRVLRYNFPWTIEQLSN